MGKGAAIHWVSDMCIPRPPATDDVLGEEGPVDCVCPRRWVGLQYCILQVQDLIIAFVCSPFALMELMFSYSHTPRINPRPLVWDVCDVIRYLLVIRCV